MKTNIISVKYEDNYGPKVFSGKAYNYYTATDLEVGDLVLAPTSNGERIARVSEINIPESKIAYIKPYLKLITKKIDKNRYIDYNEVLLEVS